MRIFSVTGQRIEPFLEDLAQLRIQVFREYPYLYDGDLDYESNYLANYAQSDRAIFVLAMDGADVVGCSTAVPLVRADRVFQQPFIDRGLVLTEYLYFGESVLRKSYRGQGIGHRFFDERESHAKLLKLPNCAFCVVQRPDDHPKKPKEVRSLEPFWRKRGYAPHPELMVQYPWREIGDESETEHTMMFWLRQLSASKQKLTKPIQAVD